MERREDLRFALKAPASARIPGQARIAARLLDLSHGGCRLVLASHWPEGTGLWLQIAHLPPRFAQIMWSHDRYAGLRFTVPLEEADFAALLASYGVLTERDTTELRTLSAECARLAQGEGGHNAQMVQLAQECSAQATRFDQDLHDARQLVIAARTQELLDRLSVRAE